MAKLTFPSQEWLLALKESMRMHHSDFRKLGFIDTRVVLKVMGSNGQGVRCYGLSFDTYNCEEAVELKGEEEITSFDPDFILEAPYSTWREMFENIQRNGKADLNHTINTLALGGAISLHSNDQLREDLFYRYNSSLQLFFDLAAGIETDFR